MNANSDQSSLTAAPLALGYAGLLPQLIALGLVVMGGEWGYVAMAGGFAYGALIFSFLGGVWWGQAIADGQGGAKFFVAAVLPSLIALALFLPWTFGWEWPGPALIYLGLFIGLSPLVDNWLGLADRAFMRLRIHLSLGLGLLTILLGVVTLRSL
ncbi:DUF3429 domain-containing protein [Altererythrobacter sp. GH1-8]|uniref:DUF3429 domain-containing protein n=1 Tax=Altererythrobacter sp. GH1-8 TaxID=3349333 RepID=UPI00374DEDF1